MKRDEYYHSNCIVEGLKAWKKAPFTTRVKVILPGLHWPVDSLIHVYWMDMKTGKTYHFSARDEDLPLYRQVWFEGRVERFLYPKIRRR